MKLLKLLCMSVVLVVATAAYADPADVFIDELGCGIATPGGGALFSDDTMVVITYSENGNAMLRCQVKGVDIGLERAVKLRGSEDWLCFVGIDGFFGFTPDWQSTHTPSGNHSLVCHFSD